MTVLDFEEAMGQIDDRIISEVVSSLSIENESGETYSIRRRHMGRTLLIAAVAAALLTAAAFAIGYSIHQRRQAQLRQTLQIDSSHVTSYVEFDAPDGETGGVVILSAIRDGKFQKLYVNISPVEKEDVDALPELMFFWTIDGETGGIVDPLPDGYDAQTKTLTVVCSIPMRQLEGLESAQLCIGRMETEKPGSGADTELVKSSVLFGTASFTPTQQELRIITFEPTVITDDDTGREITVLALELSPTGAVWHLSYDGAQQLYNARGSESISPAALELLRAEDNVLNSAVLHFSDGSGFAPGGALSGGYSGGVVRLFTSWEKAVDINALTGVTIGDVALSIIE